MTNTSPSSAQNANFRDWEFTPPAFMNRVMSLILRLPVLHQAISKMILLLTFTGRKSGKHYTTPVGYIRMDGKIYLLTKRFRKWWHNFETTADVIVRVEGSDYQAQATALTDPDVTVPIITRIVQMRPREAEIFHIHLREDGQPDVDSVREMARRIVVIEIDNLRDN